MKNLFLSFFGEKLRFLAVDLGELQVRLQNPGDEGELLVRKLLIYPALEKVLLQEEPKKLPENPDLVPRERELRVGLPQIFRLLLWILI